MRRDGKCERVGGRERRRGGRQFKYVEATRNRVAGVWHASVWQHRGAEGRWEGKGRRCDCEDARTLLAQLGLYLPEGEHRRSTRSRASFGRAWNEPGPALTWGIEDKAVVLKSQMHAKWLRAQAVPLLGPCPVAAIVVSALPCRKLKGRYTRAVTVAHGKRRRAANAAKTQNAEARSGRSDRRAGWCGTAGEEDLIDVWRSH